MSFATGYCTATTTSVSAASTWGYWTNQTSTAASDTWYAWNTNATSSTAAYRVEDAWPVWHQSVEQRQLTKEQQAARIAEQARQAEEARRLATEQAAQRQAAEAKAEQLLRAHLTPEQEQAWREERAIYVTGKSGRRFKLRHGHGGNLQEIDPAGQAVGGYCVHIGSQYPAPDNILAQKLALEHDDAAVLRLANGGPYPAPRAPV